MEMMTEARRNRSGLYMMLILVFAACLWIGWHDFDPWMPQEAVRENIRTSIRWLIQMAIQYFIPINILVFFAQEIAAKRLSGRSKNRGRDNLQS